MQAKHTRHGGRTDGHMISICFQMYLVGHNWPSSSKQLELKPKRTTLGRRTRSTPAPWCSSSIGCGSIRLSTTYRPGSAIANIEDEVAFAWSSALYSARLAVYARRPAELSSAGLVSPVSIQARVGAEQSQSDSQHLGRIRRPCALREDEQRFGTRVVSKLQ